jgi:hypothetical protein
MPAPLRHRFVAVGASNLTRMALALLDAARAVAGGPVEAHMALGHGRSYGQPSRVLGRGLGSIVDSPLWSTMATAPKLPTTALLMDVGNDLMYGSDVARILGWVDRTLMQLTAFADRLVVVGLPLPAIEKLGAFRFGMVRRILVPGSPLTLATAKSGSASLHAGLTERAAALGATFHAPPDDWYGIDPIHIRRRWIRRAAAAWLGDEGVPIQRCDGMLARWRFLLAAPAERSWFGRARRREQPARTWPDGSSLSLW